MASRVSFALRLELKLKKLKLKHRMHLSLEYWVVGGFNSGVVKAKAEIMG